ncbi:MAG: TolC family protein [Flavobacteriales bacterium]
MRNFTRHISSVVFVLLTISSSAQGDSLFHLRLEEFIQKVKLHHPIAKQAELTQQSGESTELKAKGGFDPKLEAGTNQKFYRETNYYSYNNASVKIPTRSPITIKGGYELNDGKYLSASSTVPDEGLYNAGLSVSLLQGLLTDERRTALAQARAFRDYTEAERKRMINELMYEAFGAYWNWWNAYEKTRIAQDMTNLAIDRFEAIKERAVAGDRPYIDTVDAFMQVQFRQQQFIDNAIAEIKSRFYLSSFLWAEDENGGLEGLIINDNTEPTQPSGDWSSLWPAEMKESMVDYIQREHPEITAYDAKLDQLDADLRWKKEKLKPKLDVEYNFINQTTSTTDPYWSTRNYKWGLTFSFPIFIREARGDLQLGKIKIDETEYSRELKSVELANKASTSFASYQNLQLQLTIAEQNVSNYITLLNAERTRFFNGESSVFIVNQREMALADARMKVIDIKAKLEMSVVEAEYHIGQLYRR